MKNSEKEEITNTEVEAIRTTKVKSTESIPISLTWKHNHTPTKESQVEKSSMANITAVKNVTIRLKSRDAKGEPQHTDNKIFVDVLMKSKEREN